MKRLLIVVWFAATALAVSTATAQITVMVCDPVDLHPLNINEVMMGTTVGLLVQSDSADHWSGGLFIHDAQRGIGKLDIREPIDGDFLHQNTSSLAAAGTNAFVLAWADSEMSGVDLHTCDLSRTAGDWFVVDYTPLAEGACTIHFYDHSVSWTTPITQMAIDLYNVPTRDYVQNNVVNLEDYAIFASYWLADNCAAPMWCGGADLDKTGDVGLLDLALFTDFWLYGTPGWQGTPQTPPQEPPSPTVFYALVDENNLNEITLPVGQSMRVYITKSSPTEEVYVIHLEADISNTLLGWIDNTPYDPLNPPGNGTAELLAIPRATSFDDWGPGYEQPEGIYFMAASLSGAIQDGAAASFVYTAAAAGDVTLNLINYMEQNDQLSSILIHQYDPELQMMMSGGMMSELSMQTETSQSVDVEALANDLQEIWENDPELQQTIPESEWNAFIQSVRNSDQTETTY